MTAPTKRTSRSLAPVLARLVFLAGHIVPDAHEAPDPKQAARELRHLQAVVRAAYRQAESHGFDRPCSCIVCSAVWKHIVEPARAARSEE